MRSNSGGGKSSNNSGNPTLEEHQAEKGVSGNAIRGEKKAEGSDRNARMPGSALQPADERRRQAQPCRLPLPPPSLSGLPQARCCPFPG